MSRRASLQLRLSAWLALGVTALWLAAAIGGALIVRHELGEGFDSALQETAQRLLPLAVSEITAREGQAATAQAAALHAHEEYLTYLVRDASGAVLLRSHDADPAVFPAPPAPGFRDTATHRLYGEAAVSGTLFVEVAEPLAHRREAALEAASALVLPLALLIPLSLLGVWLLVRRSLRPLLAFDAEIEARGGGDLSPVGAAALPAELAPVAQAVNRLLERLRRALEQERSFTQNSAHELRTPIAAALAQTQRLAAEAPEGPVRERAQAIEASLRGLAALAEKLLQLAKAEGGALLSQTPHDLALILAHVAQEFRAGADGGRLRLAIPAAEVRSRLDPDAFAILARNLIENALKHGAPDEPIEVKLSEDGLLRVVNRGPLVPSERLAQLKSRFARGATAAGGVGLGLAIAAAIASGAGASLTLLSPATGRQDGFEAQLQLPL